MASADVEIAVAFLSREPASTAFFTDFDGTLSPIVRRPEDAAPIGGAAAALRRLAAAIARVGIVSGRPAAWLAGQFRPEGEDDPLARVELFGLHGVEHWNGHEAEPCDEARPFAPVVAELRARAVQAAIPGLVVEDKVYGLTLHWRNAGDPAAAATAGATLAAELASESGLLERPGKASVELVAPLGIDKGSVVRERAKGFGMVAFLGDDSGDVRAFDALDDLEVAGAQVLRVAVTSTEAPAELLRRADLVLESPEESVSLIDSLASAASATP